MAFQNKTNFFGFGAPFVLTDSNENKSASTSEGHNEKGDIAAVEVWGETMAPDCTYVLSADAQLSGIECGAPIAGTGDYASKKFTVGNLEITTTAGGAPSVHVTGAEIPLSTDHSDCVYEFPAATIQQCFHAQILWSAFSLSGDGCYLQQANYTAGGNVATATKDGNVVAYDVTDGKLACNITVLQTGATKPSLTAGDGWKITAPMTASEPDADYPSWTATLEKPLLHKSN